MLYSKSMFTLNRYVVLLERFHVAVFGVPAGETTRSFIRQLHWSILGGFVASGVLLGVSVWAGRILGTGQYGKYSFAIAFAQVISLAMTWGFDLAIARALSGTQEDPGSQKYIISSATTFVLITVVVANGIAFLLPLSFDQEVIVLLATAIAIRLLMDGMIRGLGFFAYQAIAKIIEAFVIGLVFFIALRVTSVSSYMNYIVAVLGGSMAVIFWYAWRLRRYASLQKVAYSSIQMLWSYGSMVIIGSIISTILSFASKFVIRYQLGYEFLGQFTAYYMVSIAALAFLGTLIANVLFPVVVGKRYNDAVWPKMNRIVAISWLPLWILAAIATNISIALYGPSYYLAWWFGIGMAGAGVLQLLSGIYWWLIASTGVEGVKYGAFHAGISGCIFILFLTLSAPVYPMLGILISYALSDVYLVWIVYRWRLAQR